MILGKLLGLTFIPALNTTCLNIKMPAENRQRQKGNPFSFLQAPESLANPTTLLPAGSTQASSPSWAAQHSALPAQQALSGPWQCSHVQLWVLAVRRREHSDCGKNWKPGVRLLGFQNCLPLTGNLTCSKSLLLLKHFLFFIKLSGLDQIVDEVPFQP